MGRMVEKSGVIAMDVELDKDAACSPSSTYVLL